MTRTGKSARLSQHLAEPYLEIHPHDAAAVGLRAADLVKVQNPLGTAILRILITDRVRPGDVFAPMHWTSETAPSAVIDTLVPSITDPVSGQPDLKAARVNLTRFEASWYGFAVTSEPVGKIDAAYSAQMRARNGWRIELAGLTRPADIVSYARNLFALPNTPVASIIDVQRGTARCAFHDSGKLVAALFIGPRPVDIARDFVVEGLLGERPHVLAGRPGADQPDPGPTVCSCLNVGVNTIRAAIESGQTMSVEAIGKHLGAGTNCGSCRPELADLLLKHAQSVAAQ
jgi:assimilatory nitrate reductase catalytic subunit